MSFILNPSESVESPQVQEPPKPANLTGQLKMSAIGVKISSLLVIAVEVTDAVLGFESPIMVSITVIFLSIMIITLVWTYFRFSSNALWISLVSQILFLVLKVVFVSVVIIFFVAYWDLQTYMTSMCKRCTINGGFQIISETTCAEYCDASLHYGNWQKWLTVKLIILILNLTASITTIASTRELWVIAVNMTRSEDAARKKKDDDADRVIRGNISQPWFTEKSPRREEPGPSGPLFAQRIVNSAKKIIEANSNFLEN